MEEKRLEAKDLIGTEVCGFVKLRRVLFPKKPIQDIVPGEFGILSVNVEALEHGTFPWEIDWLGEGKNVDITLKGSIPNVEYGITYYFEGVLCEDKKFGLQYEIKMLHKMFKFEDLEQKILFLNTVLGESKTQLLCENFEDPIEPLQNEDIEALLKISGLGKSSVATMLEKFKNNISNSGALVQLQEYGLTPTMITKLQAIYKSSDTVAYILQHDPYSLIEDVTGVGWEKADAIALNGGYNPNGENRIRGYAKFVLSSQANSSGHSWIDLDLLINAIKTIAPTIQDEDLRLMLRKWLEPTNPLLYFEPDTRRIGLYYYRKLEEKIASELIRLQSAALTPISPEEIKEAIEESGKIVGYEFTEEQTEAIKKSINNPISVVSGSAGVGKSSIMHPVCNLLKKKGLRFGQTSLSGKAASNLSEITGEEGKTIHRLLGYNPHKGNGFTYTKLNPLTLDTIILDEVSLVGGEIFLSLIEAIPTGSRLILLGDPLQLPSIGLASILFDLVNSGVMPTSKLLKIHRQAARSGIITESLRVSAKEQIISQTPCEEFRGELQDLKVKTYTDATLSADYIMEEYRRLHFEMNIPTKDIMVVVGARSRGGISCLALNKEIQAMTNLTFGKELAMRTLDGEYTLKENDKILIAKNCYEIKDITEQESPIFNGNTGYVVSIGEDEIIVDLVQQGKVIIPKEFWSCVELGYAMTCHKCQGSAAPYVIVGIDMSMYAMLSKEWLYTAITRAKKHCTLIAQISAARKATGTSSVIIKQTWLREVLNNFTPELESGCRKPVYQYRYRNKTIEEAVDMFIPKEDQLEQVYHF